MIDVVIRGATVYDGTGGPPIGGDIAVDGGRIVSVGAPMPEGAAASVIEASGLAVAPGFIDLHTHSDVSMLSEPGCISAIENSMPSTA